jgi:hypothetical protein
VLGIAIAALAYQLNSDDDSLPEPIVTKPDATVDENSIPPRDRISPLKDGTGT